MKLFITLIFFTLTLFSSSINHHHIKILEKILLEVYTKSDLIVWSDNQEISNEFKKYNKVAVADSCEDASILIIEKETPNTKICQQKPTFVLNYELLSELPQSFGALFWKKGRPNIVIIKPRIESQSIEISNGLKPFLEEKVW